MNHHLINAQICEGGGGRGSGRLALNLENCAYTLKILATPLQGVNSLFTDDILFFFSFFSKTSASSRDRAQSARNKSIFFFPHHYPLALAVNKSLAVYILSPGLDGL